MVYQLSFPMVLQWYDRQSGVNLCEIWKMYDFIYKCILSPDQALTTQSLEKNTYIVFARTTGWAAQCNSVDESICLSTYLCHSDISLLLIVSGLREAKGHHMAVWRAYGGPGHSAPLCWWTAGHRSAPWGEPPTWDSSAPSAAWPSCPGLVICLHAPPLPREYVWKIQCFFGSLKTEQHCLRCC